MGKRTVIGLMGLLLTLPVAGVAAEGGFEPLFNGKNLKGWSCDETFWRVEDGAIVGQSTPENPLKSNTFCIWQGEAVDFVLKAKFRVTNGNSGIQYRSKVLKDWVVAGYQAEIDNELADVGEMYGEKTRGHLLPVCGEFAVLNEKGEKTVQGKVADREWLKTGKYYRPGEWNECTIVARGPHVMQFINGVLTAELVDLDERAMRKGVIALQVHGGGPMKVEYKDIRLERLEEELTCTFGPGGMVLLGKGGDLSAWKMEKGGADASWPVEDGVVTVKPKSGNMITREKFGDMRLHVEFNVPDTGLPGQKAGNSGVYIQKRYEVQILGSPVEGKPADNECGAVYKIKAADVNAALPPGKWQSYDIEFTQPKWDRDGKKTANARITVWHNGRMIHDDVEVPDKTGAGKPEGPEPAELRLQDHGDLVKFRNIWILPLN